MGNMWGTSKGVPHTETLVNKGIGGMGRSFRIFSENVFASFSPTASR